MVDNFADVVNYRFTAEMEDDLDGIENGNVELKKVLRDFWADFKVDLEKAEQNAVDGSLMPPPEETDMICEKCGSRMVVKMGRYGKFAACPNYPKCRNT
jgi:DNA topoisomerase-1